jgi:hypothetical protein
MAVALIARYDTPARLRDVPGGSTFYDAWHETVSGMVSDPAAGPWIDPTVVDPQVVTVRPLSWIGFPRATLTVDRRDDRELAFAEAEDPGDGEQGLRPRQFEYFEWFTTRDASGKVTKVTFSTETPEYWSLLASTDCRCVEALYQQHVDPSVRWDDLTGPDGTYDPNNRWTSVDGIMHFVNGINNLSAAIGLAKAGAAAAVPDPAAPDAVAKDNFELAPLGANAADDYIVREVAALGRSGFDITVHDPVGLYIDGWDDSGWTGPDGTPVGDYWTITRGRPGAVLRLEYAVPPGEGFQVGDIRIGGRPVVHGGQLAEHMTSSLAVVVARRQTP